MKNKFFYSIIFLVLFYPLAGMAQSSFHNQGRTHYTNRNFEKSREMFLKDIEIRENGSSYYFLGEIEKLENNYTESEEYFLLAVTFPLPENYKKNAYWNLIVLAEQRGDLAATIKYCKMMDENVKDSGARSKAERILNRSLWSNNEEAIQFYQQGLIEKNSNNSKEALQLFQKALREDRNFLAASFELGLAYYNTDDMNRALTYIKRVIDTIPFYAEAAILAGDIYYTRTDYRQSIGYFQAALDYGFFPKSTTHMVMLKLGMAYYQSRDYAEAEVLFTRLINEGNKDTRLLTVLSASLLQQGKEEEALVYLKKLHKAQPDSQTILLQLGTIYYRMESREYAHYFTRLLALCEKDDQCHERYYRAFNLLLTDYYDQNDYKRFLAIYEPIAPERHTSDNRLKAGIAYYHTKKYEKSIELLEGQRLAPEQMVILARAYVQAKQDEKARDYLTRLLTQRTTEKLVSEDAVTGPIIQKMQKAAEAARKQEEEARARDAEQKAREEKNDAIKPEQKDRAEQQVP